MIARQVVGGRTHARSERSRDDEQQRAQERYFRLVNYLAAAQVYLNDNVLLEKPLKPEHIKERLLGHWGTCPGINLIYLHLNQLIRRTDANILLLTGPGHGAAANLANMYPEGALQTFYPELTRDREGLHKFVRAFSRPKGFPSHLNPALPGVIHEGGELGYALATAYGAVLDNPRPDRRVHCRRRRSRNRTHGDCVASSQVYQSENRWSRAADPASKRLQDFVTHDIRHDDR